jgi:2-polyprenyl-6-methoxyphenol hydroxylase-like FAD-dependent oxidoreductase
MHVVIIGAGLGGLALAQGLRRSGIDVTVFERDAALDSRRQGYRLHLDAAARDALTEVLPPAHVRLFHATAGTPASRFVALDEQLNEIVSVEADHPSVDYAVDRLLLRRILLAGIEDAVVFGKELGSFDGGRAYFTDGTVVDGDVLVGADGVNSAVRRQYLPHARVVETGVWQMYGTVVLTDRTRSLFDERMHGIFTTIIGPDREFVGVAPVEFPEPPHRAGAEAGIALPPVPDYMTCSFGARREWFGLDEAELRAMPGERLHGIMTEAVRTWHPRVREIVAACDPATLFALPLRTSVPVDPWPTTPVTLLGDAIHAMSPAAGAGACVALRDAARLSSALTEAVHGQDVLDAIGYYEWAIVEYGFAAVRAGANP